MSIQALLEPARKEYTKEERVALKKAFRERMIEHDIEVAKRFRCGTCGADTLNYSHTVTYPLRGSAF